MKKMITTALTIALTAGALATGPAFAKGDGGAEQRAKLKAAFAEARAGKADNGPSLFDRLFGTETDRAEQAQPTTTK